MSQFPSLPIQHQAPIYMPTLFNIEKIHDTYWDLSLIYRIAYVVISIISAGILPLIHLAILPNYLNETGHVWTHILKEMLPHLDDKASKTAKKISDLVSHELLRFTGPSDCHALNDHVTDLTLAVRTDPRLQPLCRDLLRSLHGQTVIYSDDTRFTLDLTPQLEYANNVNFSPKDRNIVIEKLTPDAVTDGTLEELLKLGKEAFGERVAYPKGYVTDILKKYSKYQVYVSKEQATNKILSAVYIEDRSKYVLERYKVVCTELRWHVLSVERKANASKVGAADRIF